MYILIVMDTQALVHKINGILFDSVNKLKYATKFYPIYMYITHLMYAMNLFELHLA